MCPLTFLQLHKIACLATTVGLYLLQMAVTDLMEVKEWISKNKGYIAAGGILMVVVGGPIVIFYGGTIVASIGVCGSAVQTAIGACGSAVQTAIGACGPAVQTAIGACWSALVTALKEIPIAITPSAILSGPAAMEIARRARHLQFV